VVLRLKHLAIAIIEVPAVFSNSSDFFLVIAGLPNALGGYDETPEIMAAHLKVRVGMHGKYVHTQSKSG
jgi:hypothetical protein